MAARTKKVAEVVPLNGDVFPASDGPALQFVALDVIDDDSRVRTVVDEQALVELAADVKERGILQPVLLRSPVDGRYRPIAGRRRIRAARMAGLSAVPALVGDVSEDVAEDMELAENIQREELSLQDEAAAVRRLYDRLGRVDRVADRVKKSTAWVSKRLAVTYSEFDWRAKKLLEDGVTEDIELLQCVVKVAALDQFAANRLDREIRAGNAGRKEARATLSKLKKKPVVVKEVPASILESAQSGSGVGAQVASTRDVDGRGVLLGLVDSLGNEECPSVAELVEGLAEEQQAAVLALCRGVYERGSACAGLDALSLMRRAGGVVADGFFEFAVLDRQVLIAVFTLGAFGMPFEIGTLLAEVRLAISNA